MREYLFTSESVSEGHPDKVADRISDAVLDACLRHDRNARVACETLISSDLLVISGEFKVKDNYLPDFKEIAFDVLKKTGYGEGDFGFDFDRCKVMVSAKRQSEDISRGIERGEETGAGDQGLMFGYATRETRELMPMPIMLAHQLMMRQAELRKRVKIFGPDAKSQVTVRYCNGMPVSVEKVVVSTQHRKDADLEEVRELVNREIVDMVIPEMMRGENLKVMINPAGPFIEGGPRADTGLTGRKIIVDTYGGMAQHGGGAFSGKDATKVDRAAAYMARFAAKNIVAARLADRCTVQAAYAIGEAEPVSLMVEAHGTNRMNEREIENFLKKNFDFRPGEIIERLDLLKPVYFDTAAYGHFGREGFEWEKVLNKSELKY